MKKIRIKIRSFDKQLVSKATDRIIKAAETTNAIIRGPIPLPTERKIFTVLRSPHIDEDAREQFMQCVHKRLIDIYLPAGTTKTIDNLMKLDLPTSVDVHIEA